MPWVPHREGKRIGPFRKAWARACYKADLPCSLEAEIGRDGKPRIKSIKAEMLVHDLRRSPVRSFVRSGVSETIVMRLSGRRTANVFRRYNVMSESDLRAAAAMLTAFHNVTGTNSGTTAGNAKAVSPQIVDSIIVGR